MNPRWRNYARVHSVDPKDVRTYDFIVWNAARLAEWRKLNGRGLRDPFNETDLAAYDAWLDKWEQP